MTFKGTIDKKLKKPIKKNTILQHPPTHGLQNELNPQQIQDIFLKNNSVG